MALLEATLCVLSSGFSVISVRWFLLISVPDGHSALSGNLGEEGSVAGFPSNIFSSPMGPLPLPLRPVGESRRAHTFGFRWANLSEGYRLVNGVPAFSTCN